MPAYEIRETIKKSLADGESMEDFSYMIDALTRRRRPYHQGTNDSIIERIGGICLCLLVVFKPDNYIASMREFRLLFRGIDQKPDLKTVFSTSIHPKTLHVRSEKEIVFRPSLYFRPRPILNYERSRTREKVDLDSLLPNWF